MRAAISSALIQITGEVANSARNCAASVDFPEPFGPAIT